LHNSTIKWTGNLKPPAHLASAQIGLASLDGRLFSAVLKDSKPAPGFSGLRVRLVGTVFLAIAPAMAFLYFTKMPWTGFAIGLLALVAAWFGGERFVLRHVRRLVAAVRRLGSGDLAAAPGWAARRAKSASWPGPLTPWPPASINASKNANKPSIGR